MPVNTLHPDYSKSLSAWQMCNDFVSGTSVVKAKKEKYLPRPNPNDTSNDAQQRYDNYLKRAVFYEYSSKTVNQYLGLAFKQDPICEVDKRLEHLKTNANGQGVSLYHLAQQGLKSLLVNGRFGLWVDYPSVKIEAQNKQQQKEIESVVDLKPTIIYFSAEQIINWRIEPRFNQLALTMVVLHEIVQQAGKDGFETVLVEQYRELGLNEQNQYYVRLWQKKDGQFTVVSEAKPTINGKHLDYIPFQIFGSQTNTFATQIIPIEPLVHIEHGIYCNSADVENSRFLCGQIQPFMNVDNQTADYYNRVDENGVKVNPLRLGSETVIMLGENGSFGFAQAQPNTMATEGIAEKREIIAELGYQLGQSGTGIKTATQAENEQTAQHSQASLCVANINEGMFNVLIWCSRYANVTTEPKFSIRQQFSPVTVDVNVLNTLSGLIDSGKLPKSVIWAKAKEYNLLNAELSDDDIAGMIESDLPLGYINDTKASDTT
ncbi:MULTISPECIES: DUF4055 domain-containing protein [unclassified Moraxella]|uniref:DUF4055 domain-containing protein n=1 Tax=unclassified Moraxella TaxID=2685852 RepID=UPI002B413756|nr:MULTISPECIES: DUF4055 domain-containing protein [unclassified Moraxella]